MDSDDEYDTASNEQLSDANDLDDGYAGYDPDQTLEERRKITRNLRRLGDEIHENQDAFKQIGNRSWRNYLNQLNENFQDIKQPAEATLDAGNLVKASEVYAKRLKQLTGGPLNSGVDPDELLTKCIHFMRRGGSDVALDELTHTQQHHRQAAATRRRRSGGRHDSEDEDEDEDGGGGDMLNWTHLGRYACVPYVGRPALPGFLLGPLSVQKKVRKVVARTAPLRLRDLVEVRPELLSHDELAKKEEMDLTAVCSKVLKQLRKVQDEGIERVRAVHADDNTDDRDVEEMLEKTGITDTGNVDLVRFCVNPRSFSQTVENIFYVSMLIREGLLHLQYEQNGLPSLSPSSLDQQAQSKTAQSKFGTLKRQAVISISMPIWRDLCELYNIKEPMIEHRKPKEPQEPGARGWYS